jgi:1-acyl-sn-glycerol-3-phosphate acyltransferase
VFGTPLVLFDKKYAFMFWNILSITVDFLAQHIAGIKYTIEHNGTVPDGGVIYAIRHESAWETLVFIHKFHQPIFVLKKELLQIPFFGIMAKKTETIGVDRAGGVRSLIYATRRVEAAIAEGHPIIIFPEGTRVPSGVHVELKRGIAMFYRKGNCSVVPVVHNSGKFWPRHGFIKNPGCIKVKFLDPILPGLSQEEFMDRLNQSFFSGIEGL